MSDNSSATPETKQEPSTIGRAGGKARAQALSPTRKREIAMSAAIARWSKKGKKRK